MEPTPWVFLRGLTRSSGHWGDFPRHFHAFAEHARIEPLDLPGNGRLHRLRSPTTVQAMVEHCRLQLRQAGLAPPYRLLAMSLGAMVAAHWSQAYPYEIRSQVLINTSMRPFNPFYQRLRPTNYPRLLRLALPGGNARTWERAVLEMTSNRGFDNVPPDWLTLRERYPVATANALRQLLAAARFRAPPEPPVVPTLLLCSAQDRLVAPACTRVLALRWHCSVRSHPTAGHDLPLDDGPWVASQVRDWLEAL